MVEAVERAAAAIAEIAADNRNRVVACVTNCDIVRGVIAHHLGLPLDHMLRFDVDPASVSRIALGAWGARIMTVNERLYQ